MPKQELHLQLTRMGNGTGIVFPFDAKKVFGKGRVPVRGTIDGSPFRGTIVTMHGLSRMIVRREIQKKIGKSAGNYVELTFDIDTRTRPARASRAAGKRLRRD